VNDTDRCNVPCYKGDLVRRLKDEMPKEALLRDIARMFGVLADVTRLRILGALSSGEELCVCDVANVVGLSLSATSHQLRKLREAGAVTYRNDGRMAYYRLQDGFLAGLMLQARVQAERTGRGPDTSIKEQAS